MILCEKMCFILSIKIIHRIANGWVEVIIILLLVIILLIIRSGGVQTAHGAAK